MALWTNWRPRLKANSQGFSTVCFDKGLYMTKRASYIRQIAGDSYEQLVSSYSSALALLSHVEIKVRQAAMLECMSLWKDVLDSRFSQACQSIVLSDPDEQTRSMAIHSLGRMFCSTRDPAISLFLATFICDDRISNSLRRDANFALCEVARGRDKGYFANRLILLKRKILDQGDRFRHDNAKVALHAEYLANRELWDAADRIDWDLVKLYASPHG